jgi:Zn-dependent M28 family amino/carboxypeptidase
VLTGAEEVNLKGSLAYLLARRQELDPQRTYVLNFDNLGAGDLRIITETGSLTNVIYDNALVDAALETASSDTRFRAVKPGIWHTGDFDSLWFARAGIPSLTLSAQDSDGVVPHLHRPSDTMDNVDPALVRLAVDFAESTVRCLAEDLSTAG